MKSLPQPNFLAYLDLICCAMGAGLLLFLVAVSATPAAKPAAEESELLAVRCVHVAGERLEVGIEMRAPGTTEWVRSAGPNRVGFVAPSDEKSGAEACAILLAPAEGVWEFQPYLIAHNPKDAKWVKVKLDVYGQSFKVESAPKEDELIQMRHTGDGGNLWKVRVRPARKTKP